MSPVQRMVGAVTDGVFAVAMALYFFMNAVSLFVVTIALYWYVESRQPVVDWVDPDGPGYRIVAVTPEYLEVKWIELKLLRGCQGQTQIAIIGERFVTHIDSYPFVIEPARHTFTRRYRLPPDLPAGQYELRIMDVARCNPLFENRQVLRAPFETVR